MKKKIILISDLHLLSKTPANRLDDAFEACINKFKYLLNYARENDCIIVQAGDFFDKPRDWYILPIIIELIRDSEVEIYCVAGQHDIYLYSEGTKANTSLGILEKAGLVTILGNEGVEIQSDIVAYGANYGEEVPKIKDRGKYNILSIHAPISPTAPYETANFINAKTFSKKHSDYDLIICGDIHMEFNIDDHLINSGSMIRKKAREYNFKHKPCFYVLTEDELKKEQLPHESASKILTREKIEEVKERRELLQEFTNSINGYKQSATIDSVKNILNFIKANKIEKKVVEVLSEIMNRNLKG